MRCGHAKWAGNLLRGYGMLEHRGKDTKQVNLLYTSNSESNKAITKFSFKKT
jgi:hypothetical protein